MTLIEQRDIIQAAIDKKSVEWKGCDTPWCPLPKGIPFDFNHYQYRVKPEPREWWLVVSSLNPRCVISAQNNREEADYASEQWGGARIVHVREVLP